MMPETPGSPRWHRLFAPVDIASLALFRVAFGLLMLHHVWVEYASYGGFRHWFVEPPFHFTYYGFGWVQPLPEGIQQFLFFVQALACVGIALGLAYRLSATLNFLVASYFFLLERALFLNHAYLICLISLLMIFLPVHRAWSLDARIGLTTRTDTAPAWALYLLRFQVGVVYFFGGLAKLNPDWLRGEPMRTYLADWDGRPFVSVLAHSEAAVYLFSFGGLLLDLFIVPALLWRRTRLLAFLAAATFHLTNAWLFHIAIFPWFMIVATTLYFAPDWPRRFLPGPRPEVPDASPTRARPVVLALLMLWCSVQVLAPLRHHLYPGNPSWTEEGHHFAWRMMLRHKDVMPRFPWFIATNPTTGEQKVIDPYNYLPAAKAARLHTDPAALESFARDIVAANQAEGTTGVQVVAEMRSIQFTLHDPVSGETWHEDLSATLRPWQSEILAIDPDLMLQFAHHLAEREATARGHAVEVRAEVWASLHGRPYQPLVAATTNLADYPRNMSHRPWIEKLGTP